MSALSHLDRELACRLNQFSRRNRTISIAAQIAADDLIGALPLVISRWWRLGSARSRQAALAAIIAGSAGLALNDRIGQSFYVRRPFLDGRTRRLVAVPRSSSFPSEHTTVAFSLATTAILYGLPGRVPLLVGAGLIALGRVCAGVHYPSDVLAGAAIGSFWAFVARALLAKTPWTARP